MNEINQDIKIENFSELIQFAGTIFSFPLTKEQLRNYLADSKRYTFKIIHNDTNTTIGHCEAYKMDEQNSRLCRILIGDKTFHGKGYGTILTKILT
jgi:RimJ/RimL family protein N-acetyltransferase